jgi:putative ABC transport system permease protein
MSMLSIVLRNLLRRPVRSLLTALGVAIGIGAVVSLTSLVWGFERSWEAVNRARGTDLVVVRSSGRSLLPTSFPESVTDAVAGLAGVDAAAGALNDVMSIEETPTVLVHGWRPGSFLWQHLTLQKGRWPGNDEPVLVLGSIAAETLGKTVGDALQVDTEEFRICGVFTSAAATERTAVIMPIARLQSLTSREGMVNLVNVRMSGTVDAREIERLRLAIANRLGSGYRVFDATEAAQSNIGLQAGKAVTYGTSIIAAAVGAIGVMNTVLMSVFERLHEIGILLAIGWRRRRIVAMILMESVLLSAVGAAAGIAVGIAGVRLLLTTRVLRGQIEARADPLILMVILGSALAIGAIGGLYPAWRGARMAPTEALRHE